MVAKRVVLDGLGAHATAVSAGGTLHRGSPEDGVDGVGAGGSGELDDDDSSRETGAASVQRGEAPWLNGARDYLDA